MSDFPIRDRKVILHVRRRRWIDGEGHNVVLDRYDLVADGTSYSKEFADALKKVLCCFAGVADDLCLSAACFV